MARDYEKELAKIEAKKKEIERLKKRAEMSKDDLKNYEANAFVTFGKTVQLMADKDPEVVKFIQRVFNSFMKASPRNMDIARDYFKKYLKDSTKKPIKSQTVEAVKK